LLRSLQKKKKKRRRRPRSKLGCGAKEGGREVERERENIENV
jgi:hypothetical protein